MLTMPRDGERTLRIVALSLAIVGLSLWLLGQLAQLFAAVADVALIFIFAWALAYLLAPPVAGLQQRARLGRLGAVFVVYVALVIVLVIALALAVPAIAVQLSGLAERAPAYGDALGSRIHSLQDDLAARGIQVDLGGIWTAVPERLASAAGALASNALAVLGGILTVLFDLTLVVIVAFFMLVDGERLWRELVRALPRDFASEADLLRQGADRSFGGFLRGQLILGFTYGLLTWLILAVLGVNFALLLGVVSGLFMVIPFFGALIATFPPVLVALTQDVPLALWTFGAIVILQNIMLNVVGPRLMAHAVGIHPLFVFAALLLGARVAGLWGVFLALPIAGVLNIFARYLLELAQGQLTRAEASSMLTEPEATAVGEETKS